MAKTKTMTIGEKDELTAQAREIEMQRDRVAHVVSSLTKAVPDVQGRIDKFTGIRKAAEGVLKLAESIPEDIACRVSRETGTNREGARTTTTVPDVKYHLTDVATSLKAMAEGRVTELKDVLVRAKQKLAEEETTLKRVQGDLDRALEQLA